MSNTNRLYYQRIGFVRIENAEGEMITFGSPTSDNAALDMKFDIKMEAMRLCEFSVSLLGLTIDTINDLVVLPGEASATKSRRIEVYAGYYNRNEQYNGANKIAEGWIWEAQISSPPPEMWVTFTCFAFIQNPVEVEVRMLGNWPSVNELMTTVVKTLAKAGEKVEPWRDDNWRMSIPLDTRLKFNFKGPHNKLLYSLADTLLANAFIEDGKVMITERAPFYVTKGGQDNPSELKESTGLISVSELERFTAKFKSRLNDSFRMCDFVNVTMKLNRKANGKYYVVSKHHVGHLRGDDWFTTLLAYREPAMKKRTMTARERYEDGISEDKIVDWSKKNFSIFMR